MKRNTTMEKKDKINKAIAIELAAGVAAWLFLIAAKALGFLPGIDWSLTACGLIWIPAAVVLVIFLLAEAIELIRRLREAARRIHTALTLKDAMHGMTLNTLGPIYGVERQSGEINRHYEQRILFAAATKDKLHMKRTAPIPKPATGDALDKVAKKYGVKRNEGETDKHLQDRVRAAITKNMNEQLEGGKA